MSTHTVALDGLCYIGTLVRVERRANPETGELYPFATAIFESGDENAKRTARIELNQRLRNDAGDIDLPAYGKLIDAEQGTKWQLTIFGKISKPTEDGRQFINYVAANAIEL